MSYFLVLMLSGSALSIAPVPYPEAAQCEAAGQAWRDSGRNSRYYHCLPAPVVTGDGVTRQFKRDGYPALKCWIPEANVGPDGTMVCGK